MAPSGAARHDSVVDALGNRDGAHRLRAVGERLGHRDDVRRHAERLRREMSARCGPNPVITSSNTSRMPCVSQISRSRFR